MMKAILSAMALGLALAGSAAQAQGITGAFATPQPGTFIRSVRVAAPDIARTNATAAFYQAVFALKEMVRIERPGVTEIIMNFGATAAEARANRGASVIVITNPLLLDPKAASPMVVNVDDMDGIVARVKAHGGTVVSGPNAYPNGFTIAMVRDPVGNRIELVRQK